jgi:hypothetical protein
MKNRIRTALSFFILLAGISWQGCDTPGDFDQPDVDYFVKYYGTSLGNQTGVDMVANADGTITIVGTSETGTTSRTYFLKVDAVGNVLVEKYLSGPSDHVKDIEPYGSTEYLIVSEYTEQSTGSIDIKLLKVSSDGAKLDSVMVGTVYDDPLDVPDEGPQQLNDYPNNITVVESTGKIIVSGSSDNIEDNSSPNPDLGDFLVLAFEANPNLTQVAWNFRPSDFGVFDDRDVMATSVEAKFQNGPNTIDILCGIGFSSSKLSSNGDQQLYYIGMGKTDGNYIRVGTEANIPAGTDVEIIDAFRVQSINGGYFFVGNARSPAGKTELFFGKLREALSFEPEQDLQFLDKFLPEGATNFVGISSCKSNVGPEGYLIAGVDTKTTGSTDIWALKIDLSGQLVWASSFGSDQGDDAASKIIEMPDGKIIVLGTTELGDNQRKLSLIKINSSGQLQK